MGASVFYGNQALYPKFFAPDSDLLTISPPIQALDPVDSSLIGVIICKLEMHASHSPATLRGYIAMLAVSAASRGHGVATALVKMAIDAMAQRNADEIVLETEETNIPAMRLYERLGFLRSKKLHRYYLNGNSAYRLVLLLKPTDLDASTDFALDEDDLAPR
jgi:peptide alpha-N-acetyltransferase